VARRRSSRLKKPPVRIRHEDCIVCDACMRACPPEFGAIVNSGLDVHIVPELCTACGKCVAACPISCIDDAPEWSPSGEGVWALLEHGNDPYVASRDAARVFGVQVC
jgi:electron transport complex protein RnfB